MSTATSVFGPTIPTQGPKHYIITKNNVAYEGYITHALDVDPTGNVKMTYVRTLGTEQREPRDSPSFVPPSSEIYQYIIFSASDISESSLSRQEFNPTVTPNTISSINRQMGYFDPHNHYPSYGGNLHLYSQPGFGYGYAPAPGYGQAYPGQQFFHQPFPDDQKEGPEGPKGQHDGPHWKNQSELESDGFKPWTQNAKANDQTPPHFSHMPHPHQFPYGGYPYQPPYQPYPYGMPQPPMWYPNHPHVQAPHLQAPFPGKPGPNPAGPASHPTNKSIDSDNSMPSEIVHVKTANTVPLPQNSAQTKHVQPTPPPSQPEAPRVESLAPRHSTASQPVNHTAVAQPKPQKPQSNTTALPVQNSVKPSNQQTPPTSAETPQSRAVEPPAQAPSKELVAPQPAVQQAATKPQPTQNTPKSQRPPNTQQQQTETTSAQTPPTGHHNKPKANQPRPIKQEPIKQEPIKPAQEVPVKPAQEVLKVAPAPAPASSPAPAPAPAPAQQKPSVEEVKSPVSTQNEPKQHGSKQNTPKQGSRGQKNQSYKPVQPETAPPIPTPASPAPSPVSKPVQAPNQSPIPNQKGAQNQKQNQKGPATNNNKGNSNQNQKPKLPHQSETQVQTQEETQTQPVQASKQQVKQTAQQTTNQPQNPRQQGRQNPQGNQRGKQHRDQQVEQTQSPPQQTPSQPQAPVQQIPAQPVAPTQPINPWGRKGIGLSVLTGQALPPEPTPPPPVVNKPNNNQRDNRQNNTQQQQTQQNEKPKRSLQPSQIPITPPQPKATQVQNQSTQAPNLSQANSQQATPPSQKQQQPKGQIANQPTPNHPKGNQGTKPIQFPQPQHTNGHQQAPLQNTAVGNRKQNPPRGQHEEKPYVSQTNEAHRQPPTSLASQKPTIKNQNPPNSSPKPQQKNNNQQPINTSAPKASIQPSVQTTTPVNAWKAKPVQQQTTAEKNLLDLEATTAKFDKEKFFDQVDRKEKKAADDRDPFFDVNLSTDASDAKTEQKSRGAQRKMERKIDEQTFGAAEVNAYESTAKYGKNQRPSGSTQSPIHTKPQSYPNQHSRTINQPTQRGNNTGPRH